jgi:hypothetical protein
MLAKATRVTGDAIKRAMRHATVGRSPTSMQNTR